MTPQEKYIYDVRGYLIIENAIEPNYLKALNERLDMWEKEAFKQRSPKSSCRATSTNVLPSRSSGRKASTVARFRTNTSNGRGPHNVCLYGILNDDPMFLDLVTNPKILPYVDAMVDRPILEQFGACFRWTGGMTGAHGGHTPYSALNHYQVSEGRIYNNHLRVVYALNDTGPGEGGLQLVPGSHKADFRWEGSPYLPEMEPEMRDLFVEISMKAGSALLFTHNLIHASVNESDKVRRLIHTAYNFGLLARGWLADHTDYEKLFEKAEEGTWLRYLLRRPEYRDVIPKPELT